MNESIYNLSVFSWIDKNTVNEIIKNCAEENFAKWELIMTQWIMSNWKWYIIKKGSVKISIDWEERAQLWEWKMVWEIALLNEEERTATVEATSDTTMIILTLDDLIDMINSDENNINKEIMRRVEENIKNS